MRSHPPLFSHGPISDYSKVREPTNSVLRMRLKIQMQSLIKEKLHPKANKSWIVKAMVLPVVMYGCASWTIKKAEHQTIDAFELQCCWRLLRVPWTSKKSNQSILKEISLECSLEGLMLKLKLQHFGLLIQRADSLKKTGKDWRREDKAPTGDEMVGWHHQLDGLEFEQARGVGDGQGSLACCSPWGCRVRHNQATELNWMELSKLWDFN